MDTPVDSPIGVDRRLMAFFVHHAFVHLWFAAQNPEVEGCCVECCGPCYALNALYEDDDKLSKILASYCKDGDGWWVDGKVDIEAMRRAWAAGRAACFHNDPGLILYRDHLCPAKDPIDPCRQTGCLFHRPFQIENIAAWAGIPVRAMKTVANSVFGPVDYDHSHGLVSRHGQQVLEELFAETQG